MTDILWFTPNKPEDISLGRKQIASGLRDRGVDVEMCATTPSAVWDGLQSREEYDAIIGTTRAGALAGALIRILGGPPLIVDHVDPIRQFHETAHSAVSIPVHVLECVAFRIASHVMYVYREERGRVDRHADSSTKTHLGVNYDAFENPSVESANRIEERLEETQVNENVAVYIGGLEPIYNIEILLSASRRLDDWSVVIAGTGSLRETIASAADGEDVIYLGVVPHRDVPGLLSVSNVGVSLVDDPHTTKVLEYAAAGLPVVQLRGEAESRFGSDVTYCSLSPVSVADSIEKASEQEGGSLRDMAEGHDWNIVADAYRRVHEHTVGNS